MVMFWVLALTISILIYLPLDGIDLAVGRETDLLRHHARYR
jgi:hypothetical protein